jgi:hypothetical protein
MKIPFVVGPVDRPSETSLKDANAEVDAALGGSPSTFVYSANDTGAVDMADLLKGNNLDSVQAPDDGFPIRGN